MISYGAGALLAVVFTAGVIMVLSGTGTIALDIQTAVGVLLSVFGAYSIIYGSFSRDLLYHVLWGALSAVAGVALLSAPFVNPFIAVGLALIVVALVGVFAVIRK
ncbi:MAG: hypothetical protein RMK31_00275 [Candidatus Caldarchaeum sp.]|nr:hypothetical protein [Candidatus Caldarchaeum sp.]